MGIRTGQQFIDSLKDGRQVYVDGKLVTDVTAYAPFKGPIRSLARLYDMQHDPAYKDILTFPSPRDGKPVSKNFLEVQNWQHMVERMRCERLRTDATYGMMGRLPDFMNSFLMDSAYSEELIGKSDPRFAENLKRYRDYVRDNDICLTHALIDPQIDRSQTAVLDEAIRIVERRPDGIVLRGARLLSTLGPVANELVIGPFYPRKPNEQDYAVMVAVPCNQPNLKWITRETYDDGRPAFDRPLTSRFDEGDSIVVCDDMFVPWERVFIAGDVEAYNGLHAAWAGYTFLQAAARGLAKLRYLVGLACLVAESNGRKDMPRHRETLGELIGLVDIGEGLVDSIAHEVFDRIEQKRGKTAEEGPGLQTHPRMTGVAATRFFFPEANTRTVEAIRLLAGSGTIGVFTESDFANTDIRGDLDRYYRGKNLSARDRMKIMRLAMDTTQTSFGSRQALYEQLYVGDRNINRIVHFDMPKRLECEAMVRRLLTEIDEAESA